MCTGKMKTRRKSVLGTRSVLRGLLFLLQMAHLTRPAMPNEQYERPSRITPDRIIRKNGSSTSQAKTASLGHSCQCGRFTVSEHGNRGSEARRFSFVVPDIFRGGSGSWHRTVVLPGSGYHLMDLRAACDPDRMPLAGAETVPGILGLVSCFDGSLFELLS